MNKGLLIVEMPEACNKCEFYQLAIFASGKLHGTCERTGEYVSPEEVTIKRSDNCPLKPMPMLDFETIAECSQTEEEYEIYINGWNDCIDEILGGNNNE